MSLSSLSRSLALFVCAWILSSSNASAQTIYWGSAVNDALFDSAGNPLDSSFFFEIGTFGSFIPTDENMSFWRDNWKVLDRVSAPAASGWDPAAGFFSSSFTLLSDGTSSRAPELGSSSIFTGGEQAYVWISNSQQMQIGTEWALVTNDGRDGLSTDDWRLPPLPDPCGCGSGASSLEWRLSNASTPGFGGLNNELGPGNVSGSPASFSLQTAVLPEPGSAVLILSAALLRLRRRRHP